MSELGRILAIDYGTVRLGLAVSDPLRRIASPYANYTRRDPQQDARYLRRVIEQERVVRCVVGLPVHLSGQESAKSQEAREFGQWLTEQTGIEVDFFDERFTSAEAERYLQAGGLTHRRRKARRDMLAAQILLSAYLEAGSPRDASPGGLDQA